MSRQNWLFVPLSREQGWGEDELQDALAHTP